MKNSDMPAMPMSEPPMHHSNAALREGLASGLTKREMIAMHAMQGLLSNSGGPVQENYLSGWDLCNCSVESVAELSVQFSDALLKELAK